MNSPNPALVSRREATALPRPLLLLLCAAYVLPGLFVRDPWKSADITAFGYIANVATGHSPWFAPTVGGLPADGALLPYWIGAAFVRATSPWLDPIVAARIPFALLLLAAFACTWYAAYHLARTESAQPLPFAFGGEAAPADYARALADGALLALIASLGLLQLGHETTPELAQLTALTLYLYGTAAFASRPRAGGAAIVIALAALAGSGAPTIAIVLAATGIGLVAWRRDVGWHRLAATLFAGALLAAATATALRAWAVRLGEWDDPVQVWNLVKSIVWFAWPAWPLALWTLWRWRRRLLSEHLAVPLGCSAVLLAVWLAMAGADRALMLALPPLAVLAAFALPTLERSAAAAIDWFSVFFFSIAAATAWVFYVSLQTGVPAKPGANLIKLSPGFTNSFSALALAAAIAGTIAWLALVRWRTGRHRHPLWKSLVLPAGGVTLVFLLVMTLLLPPLDNARSYRSMVQRLAQRIPAAACVSAPGLTRPQVVALEQLGGWKVDAVTPPDAARCAWMVLNRNADKPGPMWRFVARERRLRTDDDAVDVYRRSRG